MKQGLKLNHSLIKTVLYYVQKLRQSSEWVSARTEFSFGWIRLCAVEIHILQVLGNKLAVK
jgi:hypothetical protein